MVKRIFSYIAILYIIFFVLRIAVGEKPSVKALLFLTCILIVAYLGGFLLLLGLEIKSRLSRKASEEEIRKAAFWFSFWAGAALATITTFYRGYPTFYKSLEDTLWVSLGCTIIGFLSGVLGRAISPIIIQFLKKA